MARKSRSRPDDQGEGQISPSSSGQNPRPWEVREQGVRFFVRLTPKSSRDRVQGVAEDADGRLVMKVAVTAIPEKGKANEALIRLLAKQWRLPGSSISIDSGATDRRKTLLLSGDPEQIQASLDAWFAQL